MARLWKPKEVYEIFDPSKHDLPVTCGRKQEEFIPYHRQSINDQ